MEKVTFRFNRGCQSYLYNCHILIGGLKPIKLFEDAFFCDAIHLLSFLINPLAMDLLDIEDVEFAEHLLQIAKRTDYTFILPVSNAKDYLSYVIQFIKSQNNED